MSLRSRKVYKIDAFTIVMVKGSITLLMCILIIFSIIFPIVSSQEDGVNSPPEARIHFNSNIYEVNGFDDQSNVTTTKKTTILNLKYHGENVDDYNDEKVGSNWFWVYNFANFQQTRIQTLKIRNEYVTADYNPTTNKTRIEIKNKTNSISYTKEGYYNIELYTDKGKLKYDIQPQQIASVEPIVYKLLENNTWVNIFVKMRNDEGKLIDEIVNNLNNQEFSLEKKSIYHDAFSGDISKAGLNKLVYNSNVRGIYPNRVAHV